METWAKEQVQEISHTKQVLAEIEARLAKLKESGQFHNCGIKKCCAEHDKNESHRHGNNELIEENKNLIIGSNSESMPNSKQISEKEKNQIKEYFKTKNILSITLEGDELVITHNDKSQEVVEINNSQMQLMKAVVQNQPNQSLSFSELQNDNTNNSSPQGNNNKLYYGIAIGVISGIILVGPP